MFTNSNNTKESLRMACSLTREDENHDEGADTHERSGGQHDDWGKGVVSRGGTKGAPPSDVLRGG